MVLVHLSKSCSLLQSVLQTVLLVLRVWHKQFPISKLADLSASVCHSQFVHLKKQCCYLHILCQRSTNPNQGTTSISNIRQTMGCIQRLVNITLILLIIVIVSQKYFSRQFVCFLKLVFHGITSCQTAKRNKYIRCFQQVHGPLLCTGSQAWSNDESENPNAKFSVLVKSNTSMHQAINICMYASMQHSNLVEKIMQT